MHAGIGATKHANEQNNQNTYARLKKCPMALHGQCKANW